MDQLLLVEQDDLAVKTSAAGHFIAETIHSHGEAGFFFPRVLRKKKDRSVMNEMNFRLSSFGIASVPL